MDSRSRRTRKQVDYTKYEGGNSSGSEDDFAEPTPPKKTKKKKAAVTDSPSYSPEKVKSRLSREERQFQRDLELAMKESSTHAGNGVDVSNVMPEDVNGAVETIIKPAVSNATKGVNYCEAMSSESEQEDCSRVGKRGKQRAKPRIESDDSEFSCGEQSDSSNDEDDSGEDSDFDASPPTKRRKTSTKATAKASSSKDSCAKPSTSTTKRSAKGESSASSSAGRGRGRGRGASSPSNAGRGKSKKTVGARPSPSERVPTSVSSSASAGAGRGSIGLVRKPAGLSAVHSPDAVSSPRTLPPPAKTPLGPARSPGLGSSPPNTGLGGVRIKGPGLQLRLGLSRHTRVKSLHPDVKAH